MQTVMNHWVPENYAYFFSVCRLIGFSRTTPLHIVVNYLLVRDQNIQRSKLLLVRSSHDMLHVAHNTRGLSLFDYQ